MNWHSRDLPTLFFDLSGLLQWFAYSSRPSGIQRVCVQILCSRPLLFDRKVEFIARTPGSETFFSVPHEVVANLAGPSREHALLEIRRLFADRLELATPRRFARRVGARYLPFALLGASRRFAQEYLRDGAHSDRKDLEKREIKISSGDAIVGLGDFWCHRGHVRALLALKEKSDARLVHMVHDLFPLRNPEWVHPHYGLEFVRQFEALAPAVDGWLTTSKFVKDQVESYLSAKALPPKPVDVIPMGWDFKSNIRSAEETSRHLADLDLAAGKFILWVGTIEPRKNVAALLDVMSSLHAELKEKALPCVLVGRNGWKSEVVAKRLERETHSSGAVRWHQAISDEQLASLYRSARFTVMPSLTEGWGLPVRESLAHGTPCIASRTGGMPEAGLDLARYVNPGNYAELREAMRSWMVDDVAIASERRRISNRLVGQKLLPSWGQAACLVMQNSISRADFASAPSQSVFLSRFQ